MYEPTSAKGDILRLAYVPGAVLADVPANWSLCATAGACGTITFEQKEADPGSKKKPDTMILYKQKKLSIRFAVAHMDAAGAGLGGDQPSSEIAKALDDAKVSVSVP